MFDVTDYKKKISLIIHLSSPLLQNNKTKMLLFFYPCVMYKSGMMS
jgi:hypothetical protein